MIIQPFHPVPFTPLISSYPAYRQFRRSDDVLQKPNGGSRAACENVAFGQYRPLPVDTIHPLARSFLHREVDQMPRHTSPVSPDYRFAPAVLLVPASGAGRSQRTHCCHPKSDRPDERGRRVAASARRSVDRLRARPALRSRFLRPRHLSGKVTPHLAPRAESCRSMTAPSS